MNALVLLAMAGVGVALAHALAWAMRRRHPARDDGPVLIRLTDHDVLTLHQAYEGIALLGATGSGKSSGPGDALVRALLELEVDDGKA